MAGKKRETAVQLLSWLTLLCVQGSSSVKVENVMVQSAVVQTQSPTGEFMFEFDRDEMFHVDLEKKETIWRLPQFAEFTSFDAAGALGNMAVLKNNLGVYIKRSNNTAAENTAPEVSVFAENPVVLGEPNVLICFMDKFFPPIINATWLRNGEPVFEGVGQTDFYPRQDGFFGKFHYLTFIPDQDDIYICSVNHKGLDNPINKFWDAEVPSPPSEATATVVCALGLAVGIIGIIAGTILIIKGMRQNGRLRRGVN